MEFIFDNKPENYGSIIVGLSQDCGDSTVQLPDCLWVQMMCFANRCVLITVASFVSCCHRYKSSSYGNRTQMMQRSADHALHQRQQDANDAVVSKTRHSHPQTIQKLCSRIPTISGYRPTVMLYYVHQTLFFPHPHTKERKGLATQDYMLISGVEK